MVNVMNLLNFVLGETGLAQLLRFLPSFTVGFRGLRVSGYVCIFVFIPGSSVHEALSGST